MKMCEQILKNKKDSAPINSNSLNLKKNQEKVNNNPSYRCAAINKTSKLAGNYGNKSIEIGLNGISRMALK